MRLKIRHETAFHYDQPAQSAIQILRLTPRNDDGQFVRHWRVEVDADYRLYRDEDPYGNITHIFRLKGRSKLSACGWKARWTPATPAA